MNANKSIPKKIVIRYIIALLFLTIGILFVPIGIIKESYVLLLLFFSVIPLLQIFLIKNKYTNTLLMSGFILCVFYVILGIFFRNVRAFFLPPDFLGEVIGFSQYNGYPLYFDTIIFFIILSLTFLIPFLLIHKKK